VSIETANAVVTDRLTGQTKKKANPTVFSDEFRLTLTLAILDDHRLLMKSHFPLPPMGFSKDLLFEGIQWHQGWDVFEGVRLPGRNSVEKLCERIQLPSDLTGKRVLDIGAWNGAFSFECERRGAPEIVAFSLENPETSGFNRLQSLLDSKVRYVTGSVYNLQDYDLGKFDIVLFLGVLYHLRYPLLAVDRLRQVCAGELFIETHIVDEFAEDPIWRFYPSAELADDPSNWFGPNIPAVATAFQTAGFDISLLHRWGDRASFKATPSGSFAAFENTYEGQSHELQSRLNLQKG
jgi:tRNA (mo5U34)-methyltransferase